MNEKSTKSMVGEIALDIITMGLLLAAFGTMFYNGFIVQSEGFTVGIMTAITFVGLMILFCIGTLSCLVTKVKKNALTVGFLTFSAIQVFALVCNWAVLVCLLINLFTVENKYMRIVYLATTILLIIGYIVSILSYSGGMIDTAEVEEESDDDTDAASDSDTEAEEDEEEDDEEEEEEDEEEAFEGESLTEE
jgi:hypothetical protein